MEFCQIFIVGGHPRLDNFLVSILGCGRRGVNLDKQSVNRVGTRVMPANRQMLGGSRYKQKDRLRGGLSKL